MISILAAAKTAGAARTTSVSAVKAAGEVSKQVWLHLDAEVLVLPPPVLSSGLSFCWLPIFVDIQLLHPSASPRERARLTQSRPSGPTVRDVSWGSRSF